MAAPAVLYMPIGTGSKDIVDYPHSDPGACKKTPRYCEMIVLLVTATWPVEALYTPELLPPTLLATRLLATVTKEFPTKAIPAQVEAVALFPVKVLPRMSAALILQCIPMPAEVVVPVRLLDMILLPVIKDFRLQLFRYIPDPRTLRLV